MDISGSRLRCLRERVFYGFRDFDCWENLPPKVGHSRDMGGFNSHGGTPILDDLFHGQS